MTVDSAVDVERLHRQAQRLVDQRNFGAAQQALLAVLKADRKHAGALFLLGIVAAEVGRYANAVDFLRRAIAIDDGNSAWHAQLGRCLAMLRRAPEAAEAADRALQLADDNNALTLDTIGVVYSHAGYYEKAAAVFRKAVQLAPDNPGYQFNLASSAQFNGDFDEAERAFEAAITASPRFYKAHSALSHLRRQSREKNHIARLEGLLTNIGDDVDGELNLRHALAKELEDLGQHERAFGHLRKGNARKRRTLNYSIIDDEEMFEALESELGEQFFARNHSGFGTSEPIFVVGMPRTGTTLVERIITAHAQVVSAGELQNFPMALKRLSGSRSKRILDPDTIRRALELDFSELGRMYLESTRPVTAVLPHFVDKMPLNFLYIGFIAKALPNAKIICLRRDPMDTCLSNFRQLFAVNFSYYNYAYDLLDTGQYYLFFHQLMKHWHRMLPGRVLEVQYEAVVDDQEAQTRRIVDYCGLQWDESCMRFEENESPVATASATQVRQPIYQSSIGRWKHYTDEMRSLRSFFEDNGLTID